MKKKQLVEVARSFSYKLNVGNYESRDFFCSQKAEVPIDEADKASEALYQFCKDQVLKSVNSFKEEMNKPKFTKVRPPTVEEWENMTHEEQEKLQAIKRENNRAKYYEDKKLGKIKRYPCQVCNMDHPITMKRCPEEDSVVGNGAERGSKFEG